MTVQSIRLQAAEPVNISPLNAKLDELDTAIMAPLMRRLSSVSLHNGDRVRSQNFSNLPRETQERFTRMLRQILKIESLETYLKNRHGRLSLGLKMSGDDQFDLHIDHHVVEIQSPDAREFFDHLIGHCQPENKKPEEQAIYDQMAQKRIADEEKENGKTFSDHLSESIPEIMGIAVDAGSIARNTLSAVADPASTAVTALGYTGGGLGLLSGAIIAAKGIQQIKKSEAIQDEEGENIGWWTVAIGTSYGAVGAGMVLDKVAVSVGSETLGNVAGMAVINPLSLVMYSALIASTTYELNIAGGFRNDFNSSIEKAGLGGGLAFLKEQLSLTAEEKKDVRKIKNPLDREAKIKQLLERKWERFARRTDPATLAEVLPQLQKLNEAFEQGRAGKQEIQAAKALLENVSKANFKKIVKLTILLLIGLGGLAVTITSVVLSQEVTLPSILFASMSSAWLLVDSAGLKGYFRYLNFSELIADGVWWIHKAVRHQVLPEDATLSEVETAQDALQKKLSGITVDLGKKDAFDQLAYLKSQFGEDGAFFEPYLKQVLKIDDQDLENLKISWMKQLEKRDPTFIAKSPAEKRSALLESFFAVWPAYRQHYESLGNGPHLKKFFHLGRDSHPLPNRADELILFIQQRHPALWKNIEGRFSREKLEKLLREGIDPWNALLESRELGLGVKQLIKTEREIFELIDEIQSAPIPRLDASVTPEERIAFLQKEMPQFYRFLTEKSNLSARELDAILMDETNDWLAQHPEDAQLPEDVRYKRGLIHFLEIVKPSKVNVEAVFSRLDSAVLKKVAAFLETDSDTAPPEELLLPILQLGCNLTNEFHIDKSDSSPLDEIAYQEILLRQEERAILAHCRRLREVAERQYPDFFKRIVQNLQPPSRSIQADLEADMESQEEVQIGAERMMLPVQVVKDLYRSVQTRIGVEGSKNPLFESSDDPTREEADQTILALRQFAAGDAPLFHLLAILGNQTAKNYSADQLGSQMVKMELASGIYHQLVKPHRTGYERKNDGSIEVRHSLKGALIFESGKVASDYFVHTVFRVSKDESGKWVCARPTYVYE